ncbi:phage tail protein [Salibacterium lacus]|uniref:Phage tail protein n=1 Tax=Salibacterium lacus TaxID=1898109 RepID=A0ABW5T7W6_9BACI
MPFIGEVRLFAGNYVPEGWAFCDGQLLSVNTNEALYSLIGTQFGGDGRQTFALPDFRGRVGIHQGQAPESGTEFTMGNAGGREEVVLQTNHLPSHTHKAAASSSRGTTSNPEGSVWADAQYLQYIETEPDETMDASIVSYEGDYGAHTNMMPYTAVHYIIALTGVYPSRSDQEEVEKHGI